MKPTLVAGLEVIGRATVNREVVDVARSEQRLAAKARAGAACSGTVARARTGERMSKAGASCAPIPQRAARGVVR